MKRISLICTEHHERGLTNVSELCAILDRIRPEIFFLELPPDAFDQFFITCTKSNLESIAVRRYREGSSVELVLVDLPEPDEQFFSDYESLQNRIDDAGSNSRRLLSWHRSDVYQRGFAYLNSDECSKVWSDLYLDEIAKIQKLGDQNLLKVSDRWRKQMALRDDEMMKNIFLSCKAMQFERAAFLIGASHRQSIIEKALHSQDDIYWDFSLGHTQ